MEDHDHVTTKSDSGECVKRTWIQFAREIEQSMESPIAKGFDQLCKLMTELPESLATLSEKHQSDHDSLQRQVDELRAMQRNTATEQREGRIRLQDIDRALQQRIEQAQRQYRRPQRVQRQQRRRSAWPRRLDCWRSFCIARARTTRQRAWTWRLDSWQSCCHPRRRTTRTSRR